MKKKTLCEESYEAYSKVFENFDYKAQTRKECPVFSGVMKYFPKALMEVAHVSWVGSQQHNPGKEMHWDKDKSKDNADACARHLLQAGELDDDGLRHSAKVAWRALALLEEELNK
jgi:hypothetical protein